MGSQRTRGTHSKAHRQSTCLADAMAGRRTPSVCRSPPREAAPGSSAAPRAGALPRGLPLSLSPSSAGGPQRGTPGPAAAAAEDGADDRSPPPPGCAALRCAGLGRLPARSRSPPPWPRAPPCGLRRDCSGTGRAPGRRLAPLHKRRCWGVLPMSPLQESVSCVAVMQRMTAAQSSVSFSKCSVPYHHRSKNMFCLS